MSFQRSRVSAVGKTFTRDASDDETPVDRSETPTQSCQTVLKQQEAVFKHCHVLQVSTLINIFFLCKSIQVLKQNRMY